MNYVKELTNEKLSKTVTMMNESSKNYCKSFHLSFLNDNITLDKMCEERDISIVDGNYYLQVGRYLNKE